MISFGHQNLMLSELVSTLDVRAELRRYFSRRWWSFAILKHRSLGEKKEIQETWFKTSSFPTELRTHFICNFNKWNSLRNESFNWIGFNRILKPVRDSRIKRKEAKYNNRKLLHTTFAMNGSQNLGDESTKEDDQWSPAFMGLDNFSNRVLVTKW